MDRLDLDEKLELLREIDPDLADARRLVAENEQQARRWKKIQEYDAVVGAALRDVKTPAELPDRVLARINNETKIQKVRSRRHYLMGGVSSALILSLLIGLFLWRWPDPTWTSVRVAEAAAKRYAGRAVLEPITDSTPRLPHVGLREGFVAAYSEIDFLSKPAGAYRLESPTGEHAVVVVVAAAWFPEDFDFTATYSVSGDVPLEVRFLKVPDGDDYCVLVSPNPKAFEAKALIF